jgi:putative transcriptional regulator
LFSGCWRALKQHNEKLGKNYNMVNSYAQNRRQPSLEDLYKIAEIFNVEAKELLVPIKELN